MNEFRDATTLEGASLHVSPGDVRAAAACPKHVVGAHAPAWEREECASLLSL